MIVELQCSNTFSRENWRHGSTCSIALCPFALYMRTLMPFGSAKVAATAIRCFGATTYKPSQRIHQDRSAGVIGNSEMKSPYWCLIRSRASNRHATRVPCLRTRLTPSLANAECVNGFMEFALRDNSFWLDQNPDYQEGHKRLPDRTHMQKNYNRYSPTALCSLDWHLWSMRTRDARGSNGVRKCQLYQCRGG